MVYRSFIYYHSKYHWDRINIEWYFKCSMIYCSFIFYHSIYHWDQYIYRWHSQWRWMLLNGNWMVLNGTSSVQWYTVRCLFYHSKYHWDQQIYRWCLQWYWTVLNGIERYWMVYRWPIFIRGDSNNYNNYRLLSGCIHIIIIWSYFMYNKLRCATLMACNQSESCRSLDSFF